MNFFVGEFKRSDDADYDFLEQELMYQALGESLVKEMLHYSDQAWKQYKHEYGYITVQVYCKFLNKKHATWFQLKYPQVVNTQMEFQ